MKNNKNAIALQKRNLIIFTNKYEKNLNKIKAWVRKNKKSLLINFTKENYDKVRQKLLQGKPKKLVSFLKSLDFSDEKIGNVLRVIKKYGYKKVRIGLEQFLNKHNKILTSAKPR